MSFQSVMKRLTALPPAYLLLCVGATLMLHFGFNKPLLAALPWPAGAGLTIIVIAMANALWAGICLTRAKTTIHPWDQPCAIVTGGPFTYSRNPMYLSLLLLSIAIAWWMRAPLLLLASILFVVGMNAGRIREEENVLKEKFAKEFVDYSARVRRWI